MPKSETARRRKIVSILEWSWLNLGNIHKYRYQEKLDDYEWDDKEQALKSLVSVMSNPEYLHFTCKYILGLNLFPYQLVILRKMWQNPYVIFIASRGASKSFLLAVYFMLRLLLQPGIRISAVGAGLRQSMIIYNYMQIIWEGASVLQDICGKGGNSGPRRGLTMCHFRIGKSEAVFMPLGSGEKIRGQRAQIVGCDEFSSIDPTVFEIVVRGFAAVKGGSLFESVVEEAKKKVIKEMGWESAAEKLMDSLNKRSAAKSKIKKKEKKGLSIKMRDNQIILSGTAYYQFNHFYQYWRQYRSIILNRGKKNLLIQDFPDMDLIDDIDYKDYCIIRLPVDMLPAGMMDKKIVDHARATLDPNIFMMEMGASFPSDSEGFYLASWIARCTASNSGLETKFGVIGAKALMSRSGQTNRYVMSVDPASESDNLAIAIMEIHRGYGKLVYMWTTNRKRYEELKRAGKCPTHIGDYNSFCIWQIRNLNRRFKCELIVMDTGGGGISLREGLKDRSKLLDMEDSLIFDNKAEDQMPAGEYKLEMIEFNNGDWRKSAHWALRHDLMDQRLVFPYYDTVEIELQLMANKETPSFELLDDIYQEIEMCKVETTYIRHEETATGQERWFLPKVVTKTGEKKTSMKKDRFTALMLANWGRRLIYGDGMQNEDLAAPRNMGFCGGLQDLDRGSYGGSINRLSSGRTVIF